MAVGANVGVWKLVVGGGYLFVEAREDGRWLLMVGGGVLVVDGWWWFVGC